MFPFPLAHSHLMRKTLASPVFSKARGLSNASVKRSVQNSGEKAEIGKASEPPTKKPKVKGKHGWFKSYSLQALELPVEAYPDMNQVHSGSHSYTLYAPNGSVPWLGVCMVSLGVYRLVTV